MELVATALDDVCARCGSPGPVKSLTYLFHDSTRTENLCEACKSRLLVRTRVKALPARPAPSLLRTAVYGVAAAVLLAIGAGGVGVHQPSDGAQGSVQQCVSSDAATACVSPG